MLGSETSTVGSGQNYFGSIDDSDNGGKHIFLIVRGNTYQY